MIFLCSVLIVGGTAHARAEQGIGNWEVRVTPAGVTSQGPWFDLSTNSKIGKVSREFRGFIEYRGTFFAPSDSDTLGVYLGQIGEADEVRINGRLVGKTGSFPPNYKGFSAVFREYEIDPAILIPGEPNKIHITAYTQYVTGKGLKVSEVRMGNHTELQRTKYWKEISWYVIRLGIPALCLFLSLLLMPWFSLKSERPQNALISLIGIAAFMYACGNSRILFQLVSDLTAYKIAVISALSGWIFAKLFALRACNLSSKWLYGLLVTCLIVFPVLLIFSPEFTLATQVAKIWIVLSIPVSFIITGAVVFWGDRKEWLIKLSMVFLTTVSVNDVLFALHKINTMIVLDLGFSIIIVTFLTSQIVSYKKGFFELVEKRAQMLWGEKFINLARQVAHDIRSPLQSMLFASQQIKSRSTEPLEVDMEKDSPVNILQLGLARINSILGTLIKEFKGPGTEIYQESAAGPRLTLLDKAIFDVVAEHRWGDRGNVRVEISGVDNLPTLWAVVEPTEVQAAISNIIRNAVESYEQKSSLSAADRVIKMSARVSDTHFFLEVADNGCGIPKDHIKKIFDHGFTFGKTAGTGLGLSQAKAAIERFEGRVKVNSTVGKGTTITVVIPLERAPSWYSSKIEIGFEQHAYFLDDDPSIQQFWKNKTKNLSGEKIHVKGSLKDIEGANLENATVVIDHYFRNDLQTGLDWVRKRKVASRTYLCTTAYDDPEIQREAKRLGLRILPKPLLSDVEISMVAS